MIKMIITDVDGTLVRENSSEFPMEILPLVRRLQDKGILFGTASGRQYQSLRDLFAPVAEDMVFFCENGNIVRDGAGNVLFQKSLPKKTAEELFVLVSAHPTAEILMGTTEFAYVNPKGEFFVDLMTNVKNSKIFPIQKPEEIRLPVSKISVFCPDGIEEFNEYLETAGWAADCHADQSDRLWMDFSSGNKGKGIAAFLESRGIAPEDVMYFGDNYNDVTALELVGHPRLMDSASEELKKRFPDTCDSVVKALEQILEKL